MSCERYFSKINSRWVETTGCFAFKWDLFFRYKPIKKGSAAEKPNVCMMGSKNAKIKPVAPKHKQHSTTITATMMSQVFFLAGADAGTGGSPVGSFMD
jgi:hypothetical protein